MMGTDIHWVKTTCQEAKQLLKEADEDGTKYLVWWRPNGLFSVKGGSEHDVAWVLEV